MLHPGGLKFWPSLLSGHLGHSFTWWDQKSNDHFSKTTNTCSLKMEKLCHFLGIDFEKVTINQFAVQERQFWSDLAKCFLRKWRCYCLRLFRLFKAVTYFRLVNINSAPLSALENNILLLGKLKLVPFYQIRKTGFEQICRYDSMYVWAHWFQIGHFQD